MGREVRMVPPTWRHPKDDEGDYIPLEYDYVRRLHDKAMWALGFAPTHRGGWLPKDAFQAGLTWEEYAGESYEREYMPCWPAHMRTHFQMYETTTEGTPLSPPMSTPERLAQWLADNEGGYDYEGWVSLIRGDLDATTMLGGVDANKVPPPVVVGEVGHGGGE